MKCDDCVWNRINEELLYCTMIINPNLCDRYYSYKVIKEEKKNICSRCEKDIDPGRPCWWCGNENQ